MKGTKSITLVYKRNYSKICVSDEQLLQHIHEWQEAMENKKMVPWIIGKDGWRKIKK